MPIKPIPIPVPVPVPVPIQIQVYGIFQPILITSTTNHKYNAMAP